MLVSFRFSLDEETGWVILRATLDYELMRRFTLTVLARDGGGEETTGRIRVNVLDVNDNAPLFQKEAYVGSLRENEQAVQPVARIRVRCTFKAKAVLCFAKIKTLNYSAKPKMCYSYVSIILK